ncbi:AraC family transcriptional regulator [Rhodococcus sp. TAF43]|uniref:AraC family transcriptional regulator n=1 Tax=unclassified Rhodococcus (in: high G+C Gram-positive bacteria) TaxID=192944 RepID=UPI000E0A55D1|nr:MULTISPECIES: AraC family transcriptional regulator [unclassified Rhodococcus (in: high G+C Gram-positive bacteria)]QKT10392.1 AraC family transcriptional regulator [Rhodococcus sp. W8901]RDI20591.1 AraC-like DNA-binding protein [Rhodococcus sp. AG1013]
MARPLARYAALTGYIEVSRTLGIDPVQLLRAVGLDSASLDLQDRWIPASSVARLLELSSAATGRQDFALKLAERRRFSTLGPLSVSIREEPDARSALRMLIRYQHMYNESLHIRMSEKDGLTAIRIRIEPGEPMIVRQAVELAVAVTHQLLRNMLGERWRPVSVCFDHTRPIDDSTHRQMFGAPLTFDNDFSGIITYTADLNEPNRMSDPHLRSYAQQFLDTLTTPEEPTIANRVRELVELLLPTGRCSIDQVARSLGVDRRTVHRHLAKSGQTFSSVLDATRTELANRMVSGQRYSFTEISEMLSFSTPSSFSRWFHQQFGVSPREWRRQSLTPAEAPANG